ncbi:CRISPR-associated protein, Cas5e family [Syntrophus gentianae]|uniref:CRISPR-associated protein, Cas5e family n=1 Tax=Syntrophus gentianae TaxID=43775 RepID=A0A1H8AA38_9BACT|nr:type I-E CRISPR-associated protein Cas5/CasD [Syntrophus gentianae]SEM66784.1 CRISPR-associated protein, Cas5e family [Syntrophus gentianae]
MRDFLILKLHGPMQAWGEHTFEGLRPSANFPTRSGLLGLLGACLGIKRNDREQLQQLADSVGMAVRIDERHISRKDRTSRTLRVVKMIDYHTVKDAREDYRGLKKHDTIQTWREYLYDAEFTVALWNYPDATLDLSVLETAVKKPYFTPYLGRRSCPLTRPLFEERFESSNLLEAFKRIAPYVGTIYSEEKIGDRMKRVRDVPLINQPRQFAGRNLYIHGGGHVPE